MPLPVWGISFHIDARQCDGNIINSESILKLWAADLVATLQMEAYRPAEVIYFGTEPDKTGLSLIQLITTSNIIAHANELDNSCYIDIFSCRIIDGMEEKITQNIFKWFKPTHITLETLYRQA
jgi:S-adenosylmethionine/arginine decarboxylase-like enzyme